MNIQDAVQMKKEIVEYLFTQEHESTGSAPMSDLIFVPFLSQIYKDANAISYEITINSTGELSYELMLCSITGRKHCSIIEEISRYYDLEDYERERLHKALTNCNLSKNSAKIGIGSYTQTEENILANVWGSQTPVRLTNFEEIFKRGFSWGDRSFGTLNDGSHALYFNGAKMMEKKNAGQDLWLVTTEDLDTCKRYEQEARKI